MPKLALDSNGWIISGPAENVYPPSGGKEVEYDGDKDIEPSNPSNAAKAWHYNGGNPELRETGNTPPPTVEERVEKIEKGVGVGGQGQTGIAQRIDELEQRITDLENSS